MNSEDFKAPNKNFKENQKETNTEHTVFTPDNKENPNTKEDKSLNKINNEEENFPWLFVIISVFLTAIIAIIIYFAVAPSEAGDGTVKEDFDPVGNVELDENADEANLIAGKYHPPYKIKNVYLGKGWTGEQQLLNTEDEIIIENLINIFPELQDNKNYLEILGQPQGTDFIIIEIRNDNQNGTLYKLNVNNKIKEYLTVNDIYKENCSKNFLSDNHRQMIMVPCQEDNGLSQKIYLVSLLNGNYKILDELDDQQTFNGGWECNYNFIQGEWIDQNNFQIAIFDQSKKTTKPENLYTPYIPNEQEAKEIFIENKTIELQ